MPLATLGLFVFDLTTAPWDNRQRATPHRWGSKERAGAAPAYQYLGPGEETLTLSGALMPELTGGVACLDRLRAMAAEGKSWILVDGIGRNAGRWFIREVNETSTYHLPNGVARRVEFTLSLVRYPDGDRDPSQAGDLLASLP
ncbi:phage tail protein [Pararhodospirillum photometricum]|uniref:phage tail protein n=1 Tax=Pararhodospirillum photometricum TaxID=1084 RepID=UPI0005A2CCA1|nr:phage tail protein [Pararhodospirillum photometricum]